MLAFIDESGQPQPNSPNPRPVVVVICYDERDSRSISGQIHAVKRDVLGREQVELKGQTMLSGRKFRRRSQSRSFAEEFFAVLRNLPLTVFATIMEGPFAGVPPVDNRLENRFRFLSQRVELLAEQRDSFANVLFDGDSGQLKGLSERFAHYLFRSDEGRASIHIADTPAFVDSASSAGIQIADMCAYVVRSYQENRLFADPPPAEDEYLHAVRRWYRVIEEKTANFTTYDGESRPGFYFLRQGER